MSFHQPYNPPVTSHNSALITASGESGWRALHLLSVDCECSRQVADHLLTRGVQRVLSESVFVADERPSSPMVRLLMAQGFHVAAIPSTELRAKFGVQGVPLLVLISPRDRLLS